MRNKAAGGLLLRLYVLFPKGLLIALFLLTVTDDACKKHNYESVSGSTFTGSACNNVWYSHDDGLVGVHF